MDSNPCLICGRPSDAQDRKITDLPFIVQILTQSFDNQSEIEQLTKEGDVSLCRRHSQQIKVLLCVNQEIQMLEKLRQNITSSIIRQFPSDDIQPEIRNYIKDVVSKKHKVPEPKVWYTLDTSEKTEQSEIVEQCMNLTTRRRMRNQHSKKMNIIKGEKLEAKCQDIKNKQEEISDDESLEDVPTPGGRLQMAEDNNCNVERESDNESIYSEHVEIDREKNELQSSRNNKRKRWKTNKTEKYSVANTTKLFRSKQLLKKHQEKRTATYICETCGKNLSNKKSLQNHIRSQHKKDFKFTCEICKSKSLFKSHYIQHMKKCHPEIKNEQIEKRSEDET